MTVNQSPPADPPDPPVNPDPDPPVDPDLNPLYEPHEPPDAHAGHYQVVGRGERVTLNASRSRDPEGTSLAYVWTQSGGLTVTLTGADTALPTFTAPLQDAELRFRLSVTDRGRHPLTSYARVNVGVVEHSLTKLRNDLLRNWALQNSIGNDQCVAWDSMEATAREVFLWNTHRLRRSKALMLVNGLYTVAGRNPGGDCGGVAYNRTYMSMDPMLQARFLEAETGDRDAVPPWEPSTDPACVNPFGFGECPHEPFDRQVQTDGEEPRGQIQFFAFPGKITVKRTWIGWTDDVTQGLCYQRLRVVNPEEVCDGRCETSGPMGLCERTILYYDEVHTNPQAEFVPEAGGIPIADPYVFEMDHDYEIDHDSAPSCGQMKARYSRLYGDPGWNWQPTCVTPEEDVEDDPTVQPIAIRAPHLTELRGEVDSLRLRFGLDTFDWTDSMIVPEITLVKAQHLTELRTALEAAYAAAGRNAPVYSDNVVVPGVTPIRLTHFDEVRQALIALIQGS